MKTNQNDRHLLTTQVHPLHHQILAGRLNPHLRGFLDTHNSSDHPDRPHHLPTMKTRYTNLPTLFHKIRKWGKLIENECSVKLTRHSRLLVKVCIFKNWKAMDDFFTHYLGRPGSVDRHTLGICTRLDAHVESYTTEPPTTILECDRRYIAMIGLITGHVTQEIVIHESIHAGIAYASRARSVRWCPADSWSDEESICYPSANISAQLLTYLREQELLES